MMVENKGTIKEVVAFFIIFLMMFTFPISNTEAAPEPYQFENSIKSNTVDEFTGDMSMSLPLFTVPGRNGLDYPISLSYQAGIKLDQQASPVGLGWSVSTPAVTRQVNGVPDDIYSDTDNYYFYKNYPAVYPSAIYNQQWDEHNSAQYKASADFIKGSFISSTLSMYTGNANSLVSSIIGGYKLGKQFADSANALKNQQNSIRAIILGSSVSKKSVASKGKIYSDKDLAEDGDKQYFDYFKPDDYAFLTPSYTGRVLLKDNFGDDDEQLFMPTIYSGFHETGTNTGIEVGTVSSLMGGSSPDGISSSSLLIKTENNVYAIIDETLTSRLTGFLIVGPNGARYWFNDPIESYVESDSVENFLPSDIPAQALPDSDFSSFSWIDNFPGGYLISVPSTLYGDEQGRFGTAEAITEGYVTSWGLSKVEDGNRALNDRGNDVEFEYESILNSQGDGVFTVSNSKESMVGINYYDVDEDFSVTSSGHKMISRANMDIKLMKKVITETHYVEFEYDYVREDGKEAWTSSEYDLDGFPKLGRIVLYSDFDNGGSSDGIGGIPLEKYEFSYDEDYPLVVGAPDNPSGGGRLTLESLTYFVCDDVNSDSECVDSEWNPLPSINFEYANGDEPTEIDDYSCQVSEIEILEDITYQGNDYYCNDEDDICSDQGYDGYVDNTIRCERDYPYTTIHEIACYDEAEIPSSDVVHCTLNNNMLNGENIYVGHIEGKNPPYVKNAFDRWGYFSFPMNFPIWGRQDIHNLGIDDGADYHNYVPEAWSLTKVEWPNGGTTEWNYGYDKISYFNDYELPTYSSLTGGGLRVDSVVHSDGLGSSFKSNYRYGDVEGNYDSGIVLGFPSVPEMYSISYQKKLKLDVKSNYGRSLVKKIGDLQGGNNFNVYYPRVLSYLNDNMEGAGFTEKRYTTPLCDQDCPGSDSNIYDGVGRYTPDQIYPLYEWGDSSSEAGTVPHPSENSVGLDNIDFIPRVLNDYVDIMNLKEDAAYYVMSDEPGYLFFLKMYAGDDVYGDSSCKLETIFQHSGDIRPPFINVPCENDEDKYCSSISFSDIGYYHWDNNNDCYSPGALLVFCSASGNGQIGSGGEALNPYEDWVDGQDWKTVIEGFGNEGDGRFEWYEGNDNDNIPHFGDMDYYDECKPIFGGCAASSCKGDTLQQVKFGDYYVSHSSKPGGCYDEDEDLECDVAGDEVTKYLREYTFGLNYYSAMYSGDDFNNPVTWTRNDYMFNDVDTQEADFFIGNKLLSKTESMLDGMITKTVYGDCDGDLETDYSWDDGYRGFDPWTGVAKCISVEGSDGKVITTITNYAYDSGQFDDSSCGSSSFGKDCLNMLTLPYGTIVEDETTIDDNDFSVGYIGDYVSWTENMYSQGWCENDFFSSDSGCAHDAWLPSEVRSFLRDEGDIVRTISKQLAYDSYLNPLVSEAPHPTNPVGQGQRSYVFYGDNDQPCGTINGQGGIFVDSDYNNLVPTCVEDEYGRQIKTYHDDTGRITEVEDANGFSIYFDYDGYSRLEGVSDDFGGEGNYVSEYGYNYGMLNCNNLSEDPVSGDCMNWIQTNVLIGDGKISKSRSYVDGLGRPVQSSTKKDDDTAIVIKTNYNDRGLIDTVSEPYEVQGGGMFDWFLMLFGAGFDPLDFHKGTSLENEDFKNSGNEEGGNLK
jgi:YD repeat-containing protein